MESLVIVLKIRLYKQQHHTAYWYITNNDKVKLQFTHTKWAHYNKATLSTSPAHPLFSILMSNKNATALGENTITGWAQMFLGSPTSSLCLAPRQKLVVAVFGFSLGELHSIRIVRGIWKMNTPSVWAFVCCWRKCKPHERWHQFLRWDSCCRGLRTQCHCRLLRILCLIWLSQPPSNKKTMHYYTNNVSIDR